MTRFNSVLGRSFSLFTLTVACLSIAMVASGCVSTMGCPTGQALDDDGVCMTVDGGVEDGGDAAPLADGSVMGDGGAPPDARMLPDVGMIPDGCTVTAFYGDADEDGFGADDVRVMACTAPDGFVEDGGDCDDADETRSPGETELCDMAMRDDNCNTTANEGCECYVGQTRDCPGASDVGECVAGTQACDDMGHWMATCTGTVTPSSELCDDLDNDCNGTIDDAAAAASCGTYANGTYACSFGACVGTCNSTHADCGGTAGCETPLGTRTDCEGCGLDCGWGCSGSSTGCDDAVSIALGPVSGSATPSATCAPRRGGGMACWGDNQYGELGIGGTTSASRPTTVVGLPAGRVIDSAMGTNHACAVVAMGTSDAGWVYCWGRNNQGQLGNMTAGGATPVRVGTISNAVEVVAGYDFSCARLASGAVMCWGDNLLYQLGQDDNTDRSAPTAVVGVSNATAIDAGVTRTCAVVSSGVTCWGAGASTRSTTTFIGTATDVGVGSSHTCALVSHSLPGLDGAVWCWGRNVEGQLGDLSTTDSTAPRGATGLGGTGSFGRAVAVAASGNHSCAITADGRAYCWGANDVGQLGSGSVGTNRTQPTLVGSLTNVTALEAGGRHTCAITTLSGGSSSARSLYCWGEGSAGELGSGTTDRSTPVLAAPL